jgi:hypothetical protein
VIKLEKLAKAFELWENSYRANPNKYLTAEVCARLKVSEISADRAEYFQELLDMVGDD